MAATATAHSATAPSTEASTSAAAADEYQRLHPSSYLSRYVAKGYRPDGRKVKAWRDVTINPGSISTANGSALVKLGETTMICGVTAEIAEPNLATPDEGFVVPNVDLPAVCSPDFTPGPPAEEAQELSDWLNDLLVSSGTLSPSSLCITSGKAVWSIFIDVVCLNYDGNAFDAVVLAVMAALRNTRLPRVNFDEVTGKTLAVKGETFPLPLGRLPLSCSFGVFGSSRLLPDPTAFESPLLSTTVVIALDERNRGSVVRHEGLGGVEGASGVKLVDDAWEQAEEHIKELRELLEESA